MLDCTWSDLEAEIVLRNLNVPVEEQERLRDCYLKLREEYRKRGSAQAEQISETAKSTGAAG